MSPYEIIAIVAGLAVSVVVLVIGLVLLDAFEDAPRHEPNAGGE